MDNVHVSVCQVSSCVSIPYIPYMLNSTLSVT